jgi:hypothetical protein
VSAPQQARELGYETLDLKEAKALLEESGRRLLKWGAQCQRFVREGACAVP